MKKVILVDGNNLAFQILRSAENSFEYFQSQKKIMSLEDCIVRVLKTKIYDLTNIGKTYNMIFSFDGTVDGISSFHRKTTIQPNYKDGRPEKPENLLTCLKTMQDYLKEKEIPVFETGHIETDDYIAVLAKRIAEKEGHHVYIVSTDQDYGQIISDNVHIIRLAVRNSAPYELIDKERFIEKYEITPEEYLFHKTLTGDTSDNVPGIPGCGPAMTRKIIAKNITSIDELISDDREGFSKKVITFLDKHNDLGLTHKEIMNLSLEKGLKEIKEMELEEELKALEIKSPKMSKLAQVQTILLTQLSGEELLRIYEKVMSFIYPTEENLHLFDLELINLEKYKFKTFDESKFKGIDLLLQEREEKFETFLANKGKTETTVNVSNLEEDDYFLM